MKKISLTIVLLVLFLISIGGQFVFGFKSYNEDRIEKGIAPIESHMTYLHSGHFISSVAENMESEFLQMGLFVLLTVFLYQIGSAESKKLPEQKTAEDLKEEKIEQKFCEAKRKEHPIAWRLYESSLTISLLVIFLFFFFLHAYGSYLQVNEQKQALGQALISYFEVFSESEFWFESFQNWQSEFFSIVALGLLSIVFRQYGSAQSKKMNDPIWKTGSD